jgi:hypothetical protein
VAAQCSAAQPERGVVTTTALEQSLLSDVPRLTPDEQAFLRYIVDRVLVQGRASYQPWQAQGDARCMETEIADEMADAVVYTGMRAVMRALKKQRVAAFARALDEQFDTSEGGDL